MDDATAVLEEVRTPEVDPDSIREAEAILSQKVSQTKVKVQRWPSMLSPVVGPPVMILSLQEAAENLANSGFMIPYIVEWIKEHLLAGGTFQNRAQTNLDYETTIQADGAQKITGAVKSEYRMATEKEVFDYVDSSQFSAATGHKLSKRSMEKGYILHYHEGGKLIEAYDGLPRQAQVILDLLNNAGRESYSEASIEMVLTENVALLKTKQDPGKIFAFYRRRLIDEGHLEQVGTQD